MTAKAIANALGKNIILNLSNIVSSRIKTLRILK
jgi:hypothetical protein